jgi:hypothetical protein
MARFENNRRRSYPYGFNFHRNYGFDDYETGPELGQMERRQGPNLGNNERWKKIDEKKEGQNYLAPKNDGYRGFYGDANYMEYPERKRYGRYSDRQFRDVRENHYGKGPKGYRRSDSSILEEANEALYESYEVDATNIEVQVKEGIITLTGTVIDRDSKREAENCVETINGVLDVRNELRLAPPEERPLMNSEMITESRFS